MVQRGYPLEMQGNTQQQYIIIDMPDFLKGFLVGFAVGISIATIIILATR